MRQYSESERSSALASFDNASSSSGETRSFNSSVHLADMIQPKKYRHRQSWRAGLRKTPKRLRETGVDMSGGLFRPAAGAYLCGYLLRHGVGRVRIDVRAQLVRRHAVSEKVGDRQHDICRWHFELDLVQPAPDMHLADL